MPENTTLIRIHGIQYSRLGGSHGMRSPAFEVLTALRVTVSYSCPFAREHRGLPTTPACRMGGRRLYYTYAAVSRRH